MNQDYYDQLYDNFLFRIKSSFLVLFSLIFVFIMLFLILSSKVDAQSVLIAPVNTYVNGSPVVNTFTTYYGGQYYRIATPVNVSFNRITYEYDFTSYKDYEYISFLVYYTGSATAVANVGSQVCEAVYSTNNSEGSTGEQITSNSGWVGYTCHNPKSRAYIDFQLPATYLSYSDNFYVTSSFSFFGTNDVVKEVSDLKDSVTEQSKQQHEDAEKIKDAIEGDNLDTDSIEASKNDSIDEYKNAESSLNLDGADLSSVDLGLNPTAASQIWYRVQSVLNTNAKLMTFVISMLSIGLIKLFLGR